MTTTSSPLAQIEATVDRFADHPALTKLMSQLETAFTSVPHLPESVTTFLGKIAPWLVVIGGAMGIYGSISTISYGLGMSPYAAAWAELFQTYPRAYFLIVGLLQLFSSILSVLAFSPLKAYQLRGWKIMALNQVFSVAIAVVGVVFAPASILYPVFSVLLGYYILFEMKPLYNGKVKKS